MVCAHSPWYTQFFHADKALVYLAESSGVSLDEDEDEAHHFE